MPFDSVGWVTQHWAAAAVNDPVDATALAKRSWLKFMLYL
jgi:hypothetical protein